MLATSGKHNQYAEDPRKTSIMSSSHLDQILELEQRFEMEKPEEP